LDGIVAATVTPFSEDGSLDLESWRRLLEFLAAEGVSGIYACGTTGESPFLAADERIALAKTAVEVLSSAAVKVAVHVGAPTTSETARLARHCSQTGVDALAVVSPSYYRFPETLIERHFAAVIEAADHIPMYLYNLPGYTGNTFGPETAMRLSEGFNNVGGVKDSSKDFDVTDSFIASGIDTLSGTDGQVAPSLLCGAVGAVSAVACCEPRIVVQATSALQRRDIDQIRASHRAIVKTRVELKRGPQIVPYKQRLQEKRILLSARVRAPLGAP
jgi:4-hydroxy-tetrahydrodipicolinate synthase